MWLPTPQPHLPILNHFLGKASQGSISPIRGQMLMPLEDAAASTRRYYKRKASEAVDLVLDCIAPGQAHELRPEAGAQPEISDPDLEQSLFRIYEEANSWFTKRQILSVFVNHFTKNQLLNAIPGITKWRIDEARKHATLKGAGHVVDTKPVKRTRMDFTKVDHFVDFVSSPMFLQDVAFGTKILKLSTGQKLEIPGVVRTLISSRLVTSYQAYCEETKYEPLGRSTLFTILQVFHHIKFYYLHTNLGIMFSRCLCVFASIHAFMCASRRLCLYDCIFLKSC